ncbi:hypothetical protein, partial [Streptococcus phocae]|uniref:hypothetical protein n=1 Tax=Streptococcus phocae TaxID=119224 RepID=UPI000A9B8120
SVEIISPMFATGNDYARNVVVNANLVKANEKSILDTYDEQKVEEFVSTPEEIVTTDKMSQSEFEDFTQIVYAEAESLNLPTPTQEDVAVYAQSIINLYTPGTSNYLNLAETTEKIIDGIDENHENLFDRISGQDVLAAAHGAISNSVLASAINVGVSFAVGGGVGAGIKALIMKHGAEYATRLIARKVVATLMTFGIRQVTGINSIISHVVKNVLDPGSTIAAWLDARDKIKKMAG